jgi:hypothetical protein
MDRRGKLIKGFMAKNEQRYKGNAVGVSGDPLGKIGSLSPGQRIKRGRNKITEDDPRWRSK